MTGPSALDTGRIPPIPELSPRRPPRGSPLGLLRQLRRQDLNLNYGYQKPRCCQLHHAGSNRQIEQDCHPIGPPNHTYSRAGRPTAFRRVPCLIEKVLPVALGSSHGHGDAAVHGRAHPGRTMPRTRLYVRNGLERPGRATGLAWRPAAGRGTNGGPRRTFGGCRAFVPVRGSRSLPRRPDGHLSHKRVLWPKRQFPAEFTFWKGVTYDAVGYVGVGKAAQAAPSRRKW